MPAACLIMPDPLQVCTTILTTTPAFKLTKGCAKIIQCRNSYGDNFTSCLQGTSTCQICCASNLCNVVPFRHADPTWNSTFPTCLDAEPPRFLNCTNTNLTVTLPLEDAQQDMDGVPFRLPVAADNSGNVTVAVQPSDLWSTSVYDHGPVKVILTAKDNANLTATCSFFVVGKSEFQVGVS